MSEIRSELAVEEYRALRATIRQRGTARVVIASFTFVAWAAVAVAGQSALALPITTLIPLLLLAAGFEAVYSIHIGVERIGRYLQVRYENAAEGPPLWEHTAMQFARTGPAGASDPLFGVYFVVAILLNLIPAGLMSLSITANTTYVGAPVELVVYGVLHMLVVLRIAQARRYASRQREQDLQALTGGSPATR